MKRVYKCDFCNEVFSNETEARMHEERCGYNPQNRVNNSVLFRLSMIYESFPKIVACALHEVAGTELDYLYSEAKRASDTNCFFALKQNQGRILSVLAYAGKVKEKYIGSNSNTYKDVMEEYPEIFTAIVKTLQRKAWNER